VTQQLPPVTHYLSTGCTVLDLAISDRFPGGFGGGRIAHIYGPESTGKSILALEPLGSSQRQGGNTGFLDAEGTLDFDRAQQLFGVDISILNYISAITGNIDDLTIEYMFSTIIGDALRNADTEHPSALSVDSLSAITSGKELDDNDPYGASRAKALSAGFRKIIWQLCQKNLALIFIDQTRQNVGAPAFAKKTTFSGGEALKFYASTRLFVNLQKKLENTSKKIIGINVGFTVEKNKIAPPFRSGTFRVLFDYGIDNIGSNLDWLNEHEFLGNSKGYLTWEGKRYRFDDLIFHIEDNGLENELDKYIAECWRTVYTKGERKEKIR